MNIKELENQIATKISNHHQSFDKAVLRVFDYDFKDVRSFAFPLNYFKDGKILNVPANFTIVDDIQNLLNLLFKEEIKTNKITLTIYPSGEYESSFIWDEETHLDYLETMSKTWFRSFYEEAVYRVEDRVKKANIPWDFETEVVISFTDNLPNPVLFTTSDRLKMTFKLYLNQVWEYTKKTYASIFKSYDVANLERDNAYNIELYKMMQSEELRVRFPRWNRATLWIDNTLPHTDSSRFDPKSIKLEWIDENGVIVESATSTEWLKLDNLDHSKGF